MSLGDGGEWLSLLKTELFLAPTIESMENPSFDLLDTALEDWGDCSIEDMVSLARVILQTLIVKIIEIVNLSTWQVTVLVQVSSFNVKRWKHTGLVILHFYPLVISILVFFLNSVEVVYELEIEDEMSHLVAKENKMLWQFVNATHCNWIL